MKLEKDEKTGKYIMRIDASLFRESDCLRFVMFKLIQGYSVPSSGGKDCKLEYGTAFHKGLQARAEGKTLDEQLKRVTDHFSQPEIVVPDNEWRNMGHLVNTYVQYDTFYKTNGDLLVPKRAELRFAYPFYNTARCEVILCGTIDLAAEYMGAKIIVDHKTTSAWNADEYLAEYDLSPQLMIYKWIYDTLFSSDVGCMINGVFLSKKKPAMFKRSGVINYSKPQMINLIDSLLDKTKAIVSRFESMLDSGDLTRFEPNYCACVKRYGEKASPCIYSIICKQPYWEEGLSIAESMFEKKMYNPELFQT